MIYLDSSVVLARVFGEPITVPDSVWHEELVSSRLLEYEIWNRIHARGSKDLHETARTLLTRINFLELDRRRLVRALEPFPLSVRTLDALHLATIAYLRQDRTYVELASLDRRMIAAARALGIPLYQA